MCATHLEVLVPLVTVDQVQDLLGVTVTEVDLTEAHMDVDRVAGIDLDDQAQVDGLRPRDLKLLKWAITYQAAWRSTQIDMHARLDVIEISGSTSDGSVKARDELTLQLAPLCRANLERISWKTKATKVLPSTGRRAPLGLITAATDVMISTNPMDTPDQLANALVDGGPYWGEAPDRRPR